MYNQLFIINQVVKLNRLRNWKDLYINNCNLEEYVTEDFEAEQVFLTVSKQGYENNLQHIKNLACKSLNVSFFDFGYEENIVLQVPKNIAKNKCASFVNCACDLSQIQGRWNSLRFTDCVLTGSQDISDSEFVSTKILVVNNKSFDLSVFNIKYKIHYYTYNQIFKMLIWILQVNLLMKLLWAHVKFTHNKKVAKMSSRNQNLIRVHSIIIHQQQLK
ncbi:Hypothetical_protein [Hexamita inflata]|uniref:Hypothetical_protein n=1 Tax=Hexamita inflata TaxID=28002 RepID=A0ABP1J6E9_9EUKA